MREEASGESFEIALTVLLWGDEKEWKHVSLELLFDIEEAIFASICWNPFLCSHSLSAWMHHLESLAKKLTYNLQS
jgi:hypothetical protein